MVQTSISERTSVVNCTTHITQAHEERERASLRGVAVGVAQVKQESKGGARQRGKTCDESHASQRETSLNDSSPGLSTAKNFVYG